MADRYLVVTGNWNNTACWSATDGGAGGASFPVDGDNVYITATSGTKYVTVNVASACTTLNCTGSTAVSPVLLGANLTIGGTFTLIGASGAGRKYLCSTVRGTARTLSVGTVAFQFVDLEDITAAGSGPWDLRAITGGSGDCGGNSGAGLQFTVAQSNWLRGSGNRAFSTAANWANAVDGAAGSGRVPLPQDTALLDATTGAGTITQDLPRIGTVTIADAWTGTLTPSTAATLYGSWTNGTGMILTASTQTYTLSGRTAGLELTSAGKSWSKYFIVDAAGGTWTLGDAFTQAQSANVYSVSLTRGTFSDGGFDIQTNSLVSSGSNVRALILSGTTKVVWWSANAVGLIGSNLTFTHTGTLWINHAPTAERVSPLGNYTFNAIRYTNTGSAAHILSGGFTAASMQIDAGSALKFYRGQTYTAAAWDIGAGCTLSSDTTTQATIAKSGGGTVTIGAGCTIDYLIGSPNWTFFAPDSTDGGHNSQIYFSTITVPGTPTGDDTPTVDVSTEYATTGSTGAGTVEYQFDWDDGDYSTWSTDLTASHAYTVIGTYDITVTARLVNAPTITATSAALQVVVQQSLSVPGTPTGEQDPLIGYSNTYTTTGSTGSGTIEYRFTWDDGETSEWSTNLSASHAYSSAGNYDITVTARLQSEPTVTETSLALAVTALAETITTPGTPTGDSTVESDTLQTYTTTGSTSGSGHTLEYQFNFGDGNTTLWSSALSQSHRFRVTGTYSVTVTARCVVHTTFSAVSAALSVVVSGGIRDIAWTCDKIIESLKASLPAKLNTLDTEYGDVTLTDVDNTNYHIAERRMVDGYPMICCIPDRADLLPDTGEGRMNIEHQYITIALTLTLNDGEDDLKRRTLRTLRAIEDVLIADSTLGGQVIDCLPMDKSYDSLMLDEDALIQEAQLQVRVSVLSEE